MWTRATGSKQLHRWGHWWMGEHGEHGSSGVGSIRAFYNVLVELPPLTDHSTCRNMPILSLEYLYQIISLFFVNKLHIYCMSFSDTKLYTKEVELDPLVPPSVSLWLRLWGRKTMGEMCVLLALNTWRMV